MKTLKITYWVSTILLTLMVLLSASMYVFNNQIAVEAFISLGYPTYIIYPLAFLKVAGIVVIHASPPSDVKKLAYAGFFFNALLGFFAHVMAGDGEFIGALVFLMAVVVSYTSGKGLGKV